MNTEAAKVEEGSEQNRSAPGADEKIVSNHKSKPELPFPVVRDKWHVKFMEAAIAEAQKAGFSDEKYRIGCVVVVDNNIVGTGYTGEYGQFCGALEAALRKIPVKPPHFFFFYNVYLTMEPSGKRLDNRVPEAELLVNAGVKSLFLGTCEEGLYRQERGYRTLSRNNVSISMVDYDEPLRRGHIRAASLKPNVHLILDGKDICNRCLRDL